MRSHHVYFLELLSVNSFSGYTEAPECQTYPSHYEIKILQFFFFLLHLSHLFKRFKIPRVFSLLFLNFSWRKIVFTIVCWFLPYINMNQPQVYIYPLPPASFSSLYFSYRILELESVQDIIQFILFVFQNWKNETQSGDMTCFRIDDLIWNSSLYRFVHGNINIITLFFSFLDVDIDGGHKTIDFLALVLSSDRVYRNSIPMGSALVAQRLKHLPAIRETWV